MCRRTPCGKRLPLTACASACTGAKRAALAALRARWGSDLPDAWYNRVPFSAAVCAE